jgi:hypothetical protein
VDIVFDAILHDADRDILCSSRVRQRRLRSPMVQLATRQILTLRRVTIAARIKNFRARIESYVRGHPTIEPK